MTYIPTALRREVIERAGNRCEYCQLRAELAFFPHEVDHVVAEKHGGATDLNNLALACWRCNRHKGTDLTSFDPQTRQLSTLFNPRAQDWSEHFAYEREKVLGLTPEGRTTVNLLQLNTEERLLERRSGVGDTDTE
ncbi:MAG: HNH endonuclease signature motif containing protein [Pyrinomonadaceae bacterium]